MDENNMAVNTATDTAAQTVQTAENANPQTYSADQNAQQPGARQNAATNEDMMRAFQSELDRRVTQALAKQKKEFENKLSLTGLDAQQRALAEKDQEIETLREQLTAATAAQNRYELTRTLAERSLPVEFADLIAPTDDSGEMLRRVNLLEEKYRKAVEDGVKARLAGSAAPGKASAQAAAMTKEQFRKLSVSELQELHMKNPELYRQLSGR